VSNAVEASRPEFAVTALLYGAKHFFDSMVLGASLRRPNRNYRTILMVIGDYDKEELRVLRLFWDQVTIFEDLKAIISPNREMDLRCNKFYAYTFVEYRKILVLEPDMCVAEDINEIFKIRTPGAATCLKEFAWVSDHPLGSEHVVKDNGDLVIHPGLFLIEPSSEDFEDTVEGLQEKAAKGEGFFFAVFLARYFLGGWYSVSTEYCYRAGFVSFGDNRALGIQPGDVSCKLLYLTGAMIPYPSDLYFHKNDFLYLAEHMPQRQQDLLNSIDNWSNFPDLRTPQSSNDRLLAIYKHWFSIAWQVIETISKSEAGSLLEKFTPSRTVSPKALEEHLKASAGRERARKGFRLGNSRGQRVDIDERTRTTRLRMIPKKPDRK
jgi:hypothetical protein